jgi:hypothetical protein
MSLLFEQRKTVRQDITERKVTLQPATFHIPKGTLAKPSITQVGTASWWRDINPDEPLLEIPQPSTLVAQSIVEDYVIGILGYSKGERQPGLFWIPGLVSEKELKDKYKTELERANQLQLAWYAELIKMADAVWARTNGNPLAVADIMRMAAKETGTERAWIRDFSMIEMTKCPACGAPRNPEFPICGQCKTIVDPEKYKKLGLAV